MCLMGRLGGMWLRGGCFLIDEFGLRRWFEVLSVDVGQCDVQHARSKILILQNCSSCCILQ